MTDDNKLAISLPGEWAVKKLLGPALEEVGGDLKKLYSTGRDKIIAVAIRKSDLRDGKKANLRVTRDVFWNGSYTDDAVCAEYFGGILASSRSNDGKDDRGVYYTDIIKSLSSQQLYLHYIIYHSLNKLWLEMPADKKRPNVGDATEIGVYNLWLSTLELERTGVINIDKDLIALNSKGLVNDFEAKGHKLEDGQEVPYTKVEVTTLGIQLYAVADNKLSEWRKFPLENFGEFPEIQLPRYFAFSLDELLLKAGLKKNDENK